MTERKGHIAISVIYALLPLLYLSCFETIVFDDSYDAFINNISSGQFTPFPLMDQHYLGVILVRDLLKSIQVFIPQVNVFASAYIFLNAISLSLFLYLVRSRLLKTAPLVVQVIFSLSIVFLFAENIISITHTRFATVFCGVALFQLLQNKSRYKFLWVLIFIFGFLVRPESGIGAVIIIGLGAIFFDGNIQKLFLTWRYPILTIVLFISVFYIHKSFTSRFEILIEPDIEYALSTKRVLPLSEMKTKEDSLRYMMSINGMFIDERFTDIAFLKSITKKQFSFDSLKLKDSVLLVAGFYKYYLFFTVFCLLSLILSRPRNRWRLLIYYLLVFVVLSYLDYNVSIADRHFVSIQLIVMIWAISIAFKYFSNSKLALFSSVVLLLIAAHTSNKALINQRLIAEEVGCIETAMLEFEKVFESRNVLIGVGSFHLLDRKYSFQKDNYLGNKYLLFDAMAYSSVPRNMEYLSSVCSCDASNTIEFIKWVSQTKSVILMDSERAALLQSYFDLKTNFKFQLIEDIGGEILKKPRCMQNLSVNDYFPWIIKER